MTEAEAIARADTPRTAESLGADLRLLGLTAGMTLIVHSSLSSLGYVCGGPVAVVAALMDVVTSAGTIVMPAQTGYSDPAGWEAPPVPRDWWPIVRETMPAYEPHLTPTRGMGVIVEHFRTLPGVVRSAHPALSFAAWGKHADEVTAGHSLNLGLGENSPLARLYDLDGWVLLLGAGYDSNTSFHLAQYRLGGIEIGTAGAPILEDGRRVWKEYQEIDLNTDCFVEIGAALEAEGSVRKALVGSAEARLFRQRRAVDLAGAWLAARQASRMRG